MQEASRGTADSLSYGWSTRDRCTTTGTIRAATENDLVAIKRIAVAAEMFSIEEVEFFDEMFGGWLDDTLEGHHWLVTVGENSTVVGAANDAPEPFADRMWNLYFIAVEFRVFDIVTNLNSASPIEKPPLLRTR